MHREAGERPASGDTRLQRAVVLELLSDERERRRSLVRLGEQLGAPADELERAAAALRAAGVVELEAGEVWAAPAAWRLDELELIAI
jgi:hypothetical protein